MFEAKTKGAVIHEYICKLFKFAKNLNSGETQVDVISKAVRLIAYNKSVE